MYNVKSPKKEKVMDIQKEIQVARGDLTAREEVRTAREKREKERFGFAL